MKNALILHGIFNNSQGNWFPWLKKSLEKEGYKVLVPNLIESDRPNTNKNWGLVIKQWQFNKESIIIGHSSGGAMALGFLQKLPTNLVIKKVILVSAFKDVLQDKFSENRRGLFEKPFNWQKIKKSAQEIILIHSLDDPYVKPEQAYYLQKKLDCRLIMKKHEGHFNLEKGLQYKKFPLILDLI